jgi:hypothetical protein
MSDSNINKKAAVYVTLVWKNGYLAGAEQTEQSTNIEKCKEAARDFAKENPGKLAEVHKIEYTYRMEEVTETKFGE